MTEVCYPPGADWSCAYTPEQLEEIQNDPAKKAVAERSEAMAWSTLSALLGYRLSLCPVVLRPCAAGCGPRTWDQSVVDRGNFAGAPSGGVFTPYIANGSWYNGCGCRSADDCGCSVIPQIFLPTPVGDIVSVLIDGAVLDPLAYRVDNGNRLVRVDGGLWPVCQEIAKPGGATYEPIVVQNVSSRITYTREGKMVHVLAESTGSPGNWGSTPWTPKGGSTTAVYAPGGGQVGSFNTSGGSKTIVGSVGLTFAPFQMAYETSDPASTADMSSTFLVTYYPNLAPNNLLEYAAGVLATEFYKACNGGQCRLPQGVTNISRNGITMDIPAGVFPNGATGLREVDPIIRIYNPNSLTMPSRVLSPDSPRGRVQTWGRG